MPGFLYFLPNERTYQKSMLVTYGLTHIVDIGGQVDHQQVMRGPDNQPGVVIGARASWTAGEIKWTDALQWRPFPKPHAEKQALCCWRGDMAMPGPGDLARAQQLPGEFLTLADNQEWLIPYARRWADSKFLVALPRAIDVDEETGGFVYGDVLPQYRKVWEHAANYWQQLIEASVSAAEGSAVSFNFDNPMQLIVDAIAANYRVSARELGILQAVDDHMLDRVAAVLIDAAGMKLLEKKTANDTGNG